MFCEIQILDQFTRPGKFLAFFVFSGISHLFYFCTVTYFSVKLYIQQGKQFIVAQRFEIYPLGNDWIVKNGCYIYQNEAKTILSLLKQSLS